MNISMKRSAEPSNADGNPKKKIKPEPGPMQEEYDASNHVAIDEVEFVSNISRWLQDQSEQEKSLVQQMVEESGTEDERAEEEIAHEEEERMKQCIANLEVGSRHLVSQSELRDVKLDCEWKKCAFMTSSEHKYFRHVEKHAYKAEPNDTNSYVCAWDLCDFCVNTHSDFIGHVHFHAYHTKLKAIGESLCIKMNCPTCKYDSRARNNISDYATSYTCDWKDCDEDKPFNKVMDFHHHMRNHLIDFFPTGKKSLPNSISCRWSNCKHLIQNFFDGQKHISMHIKRREYGCFTCGATFARQWGLRDHRNRQVAMEYRKYQCEDCVKQFPTLRLLKNHLNTHTKNHKCPQCPAMFSRRISVAYHIRRIHIRERQFGCTQCEYKALFERDLQVHMNRHIQRKLLRCDEFGCNAMFKTNGALRQHLATHYDFPIPVYECHVCKKVFSLGWYLSKHLNFEHQIPPPPGSLRYRYIIDMDGKYRLQSYVHEQRKGMQKPLDMDNKDTGKLAIQNKEAASDTLTTEEQQPLAANDEPVVGKSKIKQISVIGETELAIELDLEFTEKPAESVPQEPTLSKSARIKKEKSSPHKVKEKSRSVKGKEEKKTNKPKKVQDFTVMQRYLKIGKLLESSD